MRNWSLHTLANWDLWCDWWGFAPDIRVFFPFDDVC
jgi:hypothetical protein